MNLQNIVHICPEEDEIKLDIMFSDVNCVAGFQFNYQNIR